MAVMVCSPLSGLWGCGWMCGAGSLCSTGGSVPGPAPGQEPESPLEKRNEVEVAGGKPLSSK